MPALRRLFRDPDASARGRVRRRHRQPSPALRRRRRPAERLRRSHSGLRQRDRRRSASARRRRDAVLRLQRQQLPARGTGSRRRTADGGRWRHRRTRRSPQRSPTSARWRRERSSRELAFAHRSTDRVRGEERVRATLVVPCCKQATPPPQLTGALDLVEAALARCRIGPPEGGPRGADRGVRRQPDESDSDPDRNEAVATLARRAGELRDEIRLLLRAGDADYVYFVEFRGRGIFLRAAPVDVSAIVRELLLDRMRTTVLTSATLTVDGTFEYIRKRLGDQGRGRRSACRRSSISRSRPSCISRGACRIRGRADFALAAGREVVEILKRTRGRAFVLFTSYATMRDVLGDRRDGARLSDLRAGLGAAHAAAEAVPRDAARGAVCHVQLLAGSRRRRRGAELRHHRQAAVRLAVPIRSPRRGSMPSASAAAMPFGEYQVPLAILALQQGLGRLIRHRQDRGVLAVLDPRLRTKGYGRRFHRVVPAGAGGAGFRARSRPFFALRPMA